MFASVTRLEPSSTYRTLAAISIAHALLILLLWVGMFYFDFSVSGRAWLVLALLWLIWPLVLSLAQPDRSPTTLVHRPLGAG